MTAPERFAEKSDSLLHRGRRPYMTHCDTFPTPITALRKAQFAEPNNAVRLPAWMPTSLIEMKPLV